MSETPVKTVMIAKRRFDLRRDRVERAARRVLPEPISSHYVVIGQRRYPPKQVIGLVTGLDRADFTSHQARRILMGLGFAVGLRRPASSKTSHNAPLVAGDQGPSHPAGSRGPSLPETPLSSRAASDELSETLGSLRGHWVAVKDDEVLVATATPREMVEWLARHNRRADSMFRVPEDELAVGGLAPL